MRHKDDNESMKDNKNTRTLMVILMTVLLLVIITCIFTFIMFIKNDEYKQSTKDVESTEEIGTTQGKDEDNSSVDIEDNLEGNNPIGKDKDFKDYPQVQILLQGKWVLYKTGMKYPERYLLLNKNYYEETLGKGTLDGETPDLTQPTPSMYKGKYTLELDEKDSWKGILKLPNKQDVNFRYLEDERYEPILEILPNVLLIRENWEEDYYGKDWYTYPNIKE